MNLQGDDAKIQFLLDRIEIQDVLARYGRGQDDHQGDNQKILEDWDHVFTPDGMVDFSQCGEPFGVFSYKELARVMRGDANTPDLMNGNFHKWQHMFGLPTVHLDGDTATSRIDLLATHVGRTNVDTPWHLFDAVTFFDDLVRTPVGWRIKFRRLEMHYLQVFETLKPDRSIHDLVGGEVPYMTADLR